MNIETVLKAQRVNQQSVYIQFIDVYIGDLKVGSGYQLHNELGQFGEPQIATPDGRMLYPGWYTMRPIGDTQLCVIALNVQ